MARATLWKIWLVVVAGSGLGGIYYLWQGYALHRRSRRLASVAPASFAVDLSTPGNYSGPFAHTGREAFGLEVELEVEPPFTSYREAANALDGMQAHLAVGDGGDHATQHRPVLLDSPRKWPFLPPPLRQQRPGIYFYCLSDPGPPRETRAVLTVEEPATGMAGRSQRIVVRYIFCALAANLGPWVSTLVGGALLLPALLTGLSVAHARLRRG